MNHKYKEGNILYFTNGSQKVRCEIIEVWHLLYENKYPTYKVKFLEDYFDTIHLGFEKYKMRQETSIAPENMLSDN
jgi:hypothetical protein